MVSRPSTGTPVAILRHISIASHDLRTFWAPARTYSPCVSSPSMMNSFGLNTVDSISSAVFVCNILLIQFLLSHKIPRHSWQLFSLRASARANYLCGLYPTDFCYPKWKMWEQYPYCKSACFCISFWLHWNVFRHTNSFLWELTFSHRKLILTTKRIE